MMKKRSDKKEEDRTSKQNLGGGFKYALFLPLLGEMIQFD